MNGGWLIGRTTRRKGGEMKERTNEWPTDRTNQPTNERTNEYFTDTLALHPGSWDASSSFNHAKINGMSFGNFWLTETNFFTIAFPCFYRSMLNRASNGSPRILVRYPEERDRFPPCLLSWLSGKQWSHPLDVWTNSMSLWWVDYLGNAGVSAFNSENGVGSFPSCFDDGKLTPSIPVNFFDTSADQCMDGQRG